MHSGQLRRFEHIARRPGEHTLTDGKQNGCLLSAAGNTADLLMTAPHLVGVGFAEVVCLVCPVAG